MRPYRPRRAGKRWRQDAPDYILDCFDDRSFGERYTVMFVPEPGQTRRDTFVQGLGMDDSPTHPQGISMWFELPTHGASGYRYRNGHRRVRWLDLPEHIRKHVRARYEQE